jgi:hypothetical protein
MSVATGTTVQGSDGRRYTLGALLKSGGAGSVYRLREEGSLVAKIYHASVECAVYERKVQAMLSLTPDLPELSEGGTRYVQIAWPTALLRDGGGRFLGFVMPAVDVQATSELECVMNEKQARSLGLPTGLGAKITLAANLAAVIAELHKRQHRIVDLKPVNLRFYPRSLYMAMLDCDGFSIQGQGERFPAPQFTTDYLAPEFQASGLTVAGEEQQDRFALAVIVFQLLDFGIHPYSGVPASDRVPTDIPARIAGRFYPYGLQPHAQIQPNPSSGHAALPAELRQLFDRAFQGPGAARPSPLEWAALLRGYAQRASLRLVACAKDGQHQHFAGQPCGACTRAALIARARSQARPPGLRTRGPLPAVAVRVGAKLGFPAPGAATGRPPIPVLRYPFPPAVQPYYARTPSSADNLPAWVVWAVIIGVLLMLARGCSHNLARHDNRPYREPTPVVHGPFHPGAPFETDLPEAGPLPPSEEPLPEAAPADPLAFSGINGFQPIGAVVGSERPAIWQHLAQAQTLARHAVRMAGNTRGRGAAEFDALEQFSNRHHAPAPIDGPRQARFYLSAIEPDPAQRVQRLNALAAEIEASPYAVEPVCEWSWLALAHGQRSAAEDGFLRAAWVKPAERCGWLGYAVARTDDIQRRGALMRMYSLPDNGVVTAPALAAFLRRALSAAGIDQHRFGLLQARAQRDVLSGRGLPVPADVRALGDEEPSPR